MTHEGLVTLCERIFSKRPLLSNEINFNSEPENPSNGDLWVDGYQVKIYMPDGWMDTRIEQMWEAYLEMKLPSVNLKVKRLYGTNSKASIAKAPPGFPGYLSNRPARIHARRNGNNNVDWIKYGVVGSGINFEDALKDIEGMKRTLLNIRESNK